MKTATKEMLDRSNDLHERLLALLADAEFDTSPREAAALGLSLLAQEQCDGDESVTGRQPADLGRQSMRLQFEAVTLSLWDCSPPATRR